MLEGLWDVLFQSPSKQHSSSGSLIEARFGIQQHRDLPFLPANLRHLQSCKGQEGTAKSKCSRPKSYSKNYEGNIRPRSPGAKTMVILSVNVMDFRLQKKQTN
jgi:hypothetical protein